ncbi:hypothetical protein M9H77_28321 [Catharanthus roseus]|uniref:Uncharacterized protein n=1 Tax=Catharanthus roseus TaxID=4058 RepID=A0ACC0AJA7_CATRO|nr:hypothetical protein M9H77_28321 [Catharanthus roseus]
MSRRWQTLLTLIRVVGEKIGSATSSSLMKLMTFCRSLLTLLGLMIGLSSTLHLMVEWTISSRSGNKSLEGDSQSPSPTKDQNFPLEGCSNYPSHGCCSFCYMCSADSVCPK